jgi:ribosome-binding factor A
MNIRKLPRIRYRYDDKWAIGQKVCDTINEVTK